MQPRHADPAFRQILAFEGVLGDHDGSVPLPEASSAIEQQVLISNIGVRRKAKCCHVIDFLGGRLIERFNVGQDV